MKAVLSFPLRQIQYILDPIGKTSKSFLLCTSTFTQSVKRIQHISKRRFSRYSAAHTMSSNVFKLSDYAAVGFDLDNTLCPGSIFLQQPSFVPLNRQEFHLYLRPTRCIELCLAKGVEKKKFINTMQCVCLELSRPTATE